MKKATFGVLVTTRSFFNPELSMAGRELLIGKLKEWGHETVAMPIDDKTHGLVQCFTDAQKCADVFRANRDSIDGIIVSAPNFGDESSTVEAIKLADLNVPILVHSFDDDLSKMDLDNRRDSFCGKLSICSNLYQYGIKFTNTSLHTCSVESEEFQKDIEVFSSVCNVVKGMRGLRVAQIGTRPAAFQTVRASERILQASGITVIPVDILEIINSARNIENRETIQDMVYVIKNYGKIPENIPEESIKKSAKLTIAVERFMTENQCNAGAFQCWDLIQNYYGCAACLPMSIMTERGIPMACETDIYGAVTMAALAFASEKPSAFMDWNNNFGDDRDKCVLIHCANYPKSFFGKNFEISNLDILGKSLGYEKCFGACKAQVAPGEFTFAKVTGDDREGKIKCYVGEGMFTDDIVNTPGSPAVARVKGLQRLLNMICKNGFEHHVALNRSRCVDSINEALGNYMDWNVCVHDTGVENAI